MHGRERIEIPWVLACEAALLMQVQRPVNNVNTVHVANCPMNTRHLALNSSWQILLNIPRKLFTRRCPNTKAWCMIGKTPDTTLSAHDAGKKSHPTWSIVLSFGSSKCVIG